MAIAWMRWRPSTSSRGWHPTLLSGGEREHRTSWTNAEPLSSSLESASRLIVSHEARGSRRARLKGIASRSPRHLDAPLCSRRGAHGSLSGSPLRPARTPMVSRTIARRHAPRRFNLNLSAAPANMALGGQTCSEELLHIEPRQEDRRAVLHGIAPSAVDAFCLARSQPSRSQPRPCLHVARARVDMPRPSPSLTTLRVAPKRPRSPFRSTKGPSRASIASLSLMAPARVAAWCFSRERPLGRLRSSFAAVTGQGKGAPPSMWTTAPVISSTNQ